MLLTACSTSSEVVNKPNTYQPDKTNLERSLYK